MGKDVVLIGYSGHAFVVYEIFLSRERNIAGYCEPAPKKLNPFKLPYLGNEIESSVIGRLKSFDYFVAVGDIAARKKIHEQLAGKIQPPVNAIHPRSVLSGGVEIGNGVMVAPGAVINALSRIGDGVICNSASVIEHECEIGAFAHIAPGAVLCGNVKVGGQSFIGAGAVVKEGVEIGKGVTVGAGTVVIKNIPDGAVVVGNPQRFI